MIVKIQRIEGSKDCLIQRQGGAGRVTQAMTPEILFGLSGRPLGYFEARVSGGKYEVKYVVKDQIW